MEDRFKFRVYFKGSEYAKAGYEDLTRKDVIYSLRPDGQIIRNIVYECQQEGHEGRDCNMPFTPNNDLYDIQFCTGLKDKNGKLIYEGDIVREYFGETGTYQVVFCKYTARFEFANLDDEDYDWQMYSQQFEGMAEHQGISTDLEIIGNIHENPELVGGV